VAGTLATAGWLADHGFGGEATAVAARGHNLVFVSPPAPAWAIPVLAGAVRRLLTERRGPMLALCPAEAVDEWARVTESLAAGTGLRLASAHAPGRLTRLFKSDAVDLAFTTPDTALELVRRAALKMDAVSAVLLLWPEMWGGDELLTVLLQDVPKETQRMVVTADAAGSALLIERHCWRAPVVDILGPDWTDSPPSVRSAPVAWRRRIEALGDLVEQLDPESLAIWVADRSDEAAIAHALAAAGTSATITSELPPRSSLIIAYDLPTPNRLRELAAAGELLLLVPPGTEAFVERLAPRRRPVHLRGLLDRALAELETTRRTIVGVLERGARGSSFHAIAPLLERHEAPAVAAALYELWGESRSAVAAPAPTPAPARGEPPPRIWVGIGRRDEVTPHDLVGALVKECQVPRDAVGRVEIRETFSIVELGPGSDAGQIAERMTGKMIRKRRLVARLDKGRSAGPERPKRN
jgi:hypothetical protein